MSEQGIGRSPFAVIAELASVTVLLFYIYTYSFFHGFMFAIKYHFLSLFSATDVVPYLPATLFETGRLSLAAGLFAAFTGYIARKSHAPSIISALLILVFAFPALVLFSPWPKNVWYYLRHVFSATIIAESSLVFSLLYGAAIFIGWRFIFPRSEFLNGTRVIGYFLVFTGAALNAYTNGYFYCLYTLFASNEYCLKDQDPTPSTGRLIIASDQNVLFYKRDSEMRVVSFNATKSITAGPCDADKPPAEKPSPKTQ